MIQIIETTDIRRIQQLASRCYMDAYKEIHSEEQNRFSFNEMYSTSSLRHQFEELHSRFFILHDGDRDQGYMAIYPIETAQWMLDKLYLTPSSKGMGYGRMLVEHAIQLIREAERTPFEVVLNVNRRNEAVAFYQHLGFEITGSWDRTIADGRWIMDGYEMRLTKQIAEPR